MGSSPLKPRQIIQRTHMQLWWFGFNPSTATWLHFAQQQLSAFCTSCPHAPAYIRTHTYLLHSEVMQIIYSDTTHNSTPPTLSLKRHISLKFWPLLSFREWFFFCEDHIFKSSSFNGDFSSFWKEGHFVRWIFRKGTQRGPVATNWIHHFTFHSFVICWNWDD